MFINYIGGINENIEDSRYPRLNKKEKAAKIAFQETRDEEIRALDGIFKQKKFSERVFSFSTINEIAGKHDVDGMTEKLSLMKNIVEIKGGSIYSWDTETLGGFAIGNAVSTQQEKAMAGITELAIVKQVFSAGNNGKQDTEIVSSYFFGINSTQRESYQDLISRASTGSWDALSDVEQSTIQRLGMYSDKSKFKKVKGLWTITGNATDVSPRDLKAALSGVSNLYEMPGQTQAWGSDVAKGMLEKAQNELVNAELVTGYNTSKYDIPVLKESLEFHGSKVISRNNELDVMSTMQAMNQGKTLKFHEDARRALGIDTPVGKSPGSLVEYLRSVNEEIDAHVAVADTEGTLKLVTAIIPGTEKTIYNQALDALKGYTEAPSNQIINTANKDSRVLFVNKAVKLETNSWDNVKGISKEAKTYLEYGLNRGNFYNIDNFSYVPDANLAKEISSKTKGKGIYSLTLSNASDLSDDTVTIMKESIEDFDYLFNNNLSVVPFIHSNNPVNNIYGVTKDVINAQTKAAQVDKARRSFDAMFQLNTGKGFSQAERMYKTYDNVNKVYNDTTGLGKMTKEQVSTLIDKGELKIHTGNGKNKITTILKKDDIFKGLENDYGKEVEERLMAFRELYDVLGDTHETMSSIISGINEASSKQTPYGKGNNQARNYIEKQKTLALNDAFENVKAQIVEKIKKDPKLDPNINLGTSIENKIMSAKTYADIAVADVMGKDGLTRIKANSKIDTSNGIYNLTKTIGDASLSDTQRELKQLEFLKDMVGDLEHRGIFAEGYAKNFMTSNKNAYHTSDMIGADLFRVIQDARDNFTPGTMMNVNETLKALLDGGKDTEEKYKIFDAYKKLTSNQPLVINSNGYSVVGETIDSHAKDLLNAKAIGSASVGKVRGTVFGSTETFRTIDSTGKEVYSMNTSIIDFLKNPENRLNYSEENIKTFEEMLYSNKYGMVGKYDYSVSLFNAPNKSGNIVPFMAITDKAHSHSVREAIGRSEMPENAITQALPMINKTGPSDTIKYGLSEKGIINRFESYVEKGEGPAYLRVTTKQVNTIDETLSGYKINHKKLKKIIEEKLFGEGTKTLNRTFGSPIANAPALSGAQTVIKDGIKMRGLIPNVIDALMGKYVDVSSTINYLPMLYDNNPEVKSAIQGLWGEGGEKTAQNFMDKWKQSMNSGEYGTLKTFDGIPIELSEYFSKNFLRGHNLAQKISDGEGYGADLMKKLLGYNPSQIIGEHKAQDMFVMMDNPIEYNAYGFMTGLTRPNQNQWNSFHAIDINEINKEKGAHFLSDLENKTGITIGESVVSKKMFTNYLTDMAEKDYEVATGITGTYKNMNTEEVYKALDDTLSKKGEILERLRSNNQNYNSTDFEMIWDKYRDGIGSTHEQHSLMNPIVKNGVFDKHELISQIIDEDLINNKEFDIKAPITNKTVVGSKKINGENNKTRYKKVEGTIVYKEGNKIFIDPTNPQIEDIKYGLFGAEKTVGSVVSQEKINNKSYDALIQEIWDSTFGIKTTMVGNFEFLKHETPAVATSYITYIAGMVAGNEKEETNFIDRMNSNNLQYWNAKFEDAPKTGKRVLTINGNPVEDDYFAGIENLVNSYRGDTDNALSKQIVSGIKDMEESNSYRGSIRRLLLSESTPSKGAIDEVGGKGLKVTSRDLQVFGMQTAEGNPFRKLDGEKYEKIAKPIIDHRRDLIKGSREYKEGLEEINNMRIAVLDTLGDAHGGIIKDVNLEDIKIPVGGVAAEDLYQTIFENLAKMNGGDNEGQVINAYRVHLPKNVTTIDPFSSKAVSQFTVPVTKSHLANDVVYMSGTQKSSADLITALQLLQENHSDGKNIVEFQNDINKKLLNMYLTMDSEMGSKKGIMNGLMLSGRIEFSGQAMSSHIIAPLFETVNGKNQYVGKISKNTKGVETAIETMADGSSKYKNVAYMSKQKLENMGVNFSDIGHQVLMEQLEADKELAELLVSKKLITKNLATSYSMVGYSSKSNNYSVVTSMQKPIWDMDDNALAKEDPRLFKSIKKEFKKDMKAYEKDVARVEGLIGEEQMIERGVNGTVLRYPTIYDTSQLAINTKYSRTLDGLGDVAVVDPFTAKLLNLDTDGDKLSFVFNLEKVGKGKNSRIRLMDKENVWEKATVDLMDVQASVNGNSIDRVVKAMNLDAEKTGRTLSGYKEVVSKTHSTQNYLRDDNAIVTAIKARHNKLGVGQLSNPGYILRDIGEATLTNSEDGLKQLSYIAASTALSEQEIISVKLIKNGEDKITTAGMYKRGIDKIINNNYKGDRKKGLGMLITSLDKGGVYPEAEMPTVEEIMNKTSKLDTDAKKHINAIYNVSITDKAKEIYSSSLLGDNAGRPDQRRIDGLAKSMRGIDPNGSNILDSKVNVIQESSELNGININGKRIEKGQLLVSNSKESNIPQSVYKFAEHGRGKTTGEAYARIIDVNNESEHFIYGHNLLDISYNMETNFNAPQMKYITGALANETKNQELTKSVAVRVQQDFIENSMTNYKTFRKNSAEAEVISILSSEHISDKMEVTKIVDEVMLKHKVKSDIVRNELIGIDNTLSKSERVGRVQAYQEFFGTSHGASVETMANVTGVLEGHSIKESQSGEMIRAFNEATRQRGSNPMPSAQERSDIMTQMIIDKIGPVHTNSNNVINEFINQSENLAYEIPKANKNVENIVEKINNVKTYNGAGVLEQLNTNFETASVNISKETLEKYGVSKAKEFAKDAFINKPLLKAELHQISVNERLGDYYSRLVKDGSDESKNFLNWNNITSDLSLNSEIEELGKSKIAASGKFIGASINELSMEDLRKIHGSTVTAEMKEAQILALTGTKERISMYFEQVDKLGAGGNEAITNRKTNLVSRGLLGSDEINNLGDINEAIKKAGEEAAIRTESAAVKLEKETIKNAGDVIRNLKGWQKGALVGVVAGGIALGLASVTAGSQYTAPSSALRPQRKPNGKGSSDINGDFDEPDDNQRTAPASSSSARLEEPRGIKYNISAKSNGHVEASSFSGLIENIIRNNTNVGPKLNLSLNTQNDTKNVTDQWLQNKVKNLIR